MALAGCDAAQKGSRSRSAQRGYGLVLVVKVRLRVDERLLFVNSSSVTAKRTPMQRVIPSTSFTLMYGSHVEYGSVLFTHEKHENSFELINTSPAMRPASEHRNSHPLLPKKSSPTEDQAKRHAPHDKAASGQSTSPCSGCQWAPQRGS